MIYLSISPLTSHTPILLPQLLLRDAHEFARAVGRGEVGEGFEFLVVDLFTTPRLANADVAAGKERTGEMG